MTAYILKRFLNLIPTFFLATFLAWIVIEMAPGDFASQFSFNQVDPNQAARIREVLGLEKPWHVRYLYWLRNLILNFDLGTSMTSKGEVTALIGPRMVNSFILLLPATFLTFAIAIPIGVYSALRKYSLSDKSLTVFSLIGLAIPNFFLALLFLAFAVQWFQSFGFFLFPTGGMTSPDYSGLSTWGKLLDVVWHLLIPMIVVTLSSLSTVCCTQRLETPR